MRYRLWLARDAIRGISVITSYRPCVARITAGRDMHSTMTRQHFAAVIGSAVIAVSLLPAASYAASPIEGRAIEKCMSVYNRGVDHREALILCRPLAEHGVPHAQNVLGEIYMYGEGISQDFDEAAKWFRLAAEQHHRRAQFMLGVLYWSGDGVPQDYDKAVKWFRRAEDRLSVANTQTDASGPGQDGAFGNE